MRPTGREIVNAVDTLGILRFFPQGPRERNTIMEILESMVGEAHQLSWLVDTMINNCNDWPGPKEMRGIFCTRFKPADKKGANCSISGFTASDGEVRFLEKQTQEQSRLTSGAGQLLIEGSISPEEIADSERAKREIVDLFDCVKTIPKAEQARPASRIEQAEASERRRPITAADFEVLRGGK